ncbi:MAG: SAM-dependent methyltransferase [Planctomycetes bacterium]|nr:SAM-dependent methyltransferase [Planctomycetota bacterium]
METKETIGELLRASKELLKIIELDVDQSGDEREIKKFNEVTGFCEQVVRIIETYPQDKEIVFLDCSCGKSYLSFALNIILAKQFVVNNSFYCVDTNRTLIEKCERIRESLGFRNMHFINGRIIDVQPEKPVDIVIALHACDIATDEAIAKGIKLGAKYIVVVPCCENQIRSRLKIGHPLVDLTDFGLLRYRFADILTEALRAQFLTGAGYHVKLTEVTSPKFTPKNLMIIARKKRGNKSYNLDKYKRLNEMFNTEFVLNNYFNECELGQNNLLSPVN